MPLFFPLIFAGAAGIVGWKANTKLSEPLRITVPLMPMPEAQSSGSLSATKLFAIAAIIFAGAFAVKSLGKALK